MEQIALLNFRSLSFYFVHTKITKTLGYNPTKANGYVARNGTIRVAMQQHHSVHRPETSAPSPTK
jgi:hypothetical protein